MSKVSTIFFDLDGTLRDTEDVVYDAMQHAVETHVGKRPTREELRPHIHHHTVVHKELVHGVPVDDFVNTYRGKLYQNWDNVTLFEAAMETVQTLSEKGYVLAVVTSANQQGSHDFVQKWGLDEYFDVISGLTETMQPKPAPDLILNALSLTGCKPEAAVMIGDLPADVMAAHAAGVRCIGITHGFGSRETLEAAGADFIVDSLAEIPPVIEQIEQI